MPIGIDAEFPGYYPDVLVDRALSESEKDFLQSHNADLSENREWFYRLWTLKEAYVKKYGIGVDTDLTDFSFTFSNVQGTLSRLLFRSGYLMLSNELKSWAHFICLLRRS